MPRQIWINLPVKDLDRSVAFFTALGFGFDAKFTDDNATCLVIGDGIYAMLLVEKFFGTFTTKAIADTRATSEVILAVQLEDRAAVDTMAAKATAAGAGASGETRDLGFMYQRGFQDPDGHLWEVFWMDPAGPPAG